MNQRPRWELPALIAITCVGAVVRLWRLGAQSLWSDELGTLVTCIKPLYKTVAAISLTDVNPVFSYIVFHFWQMLGHGEWLLRLLPALLGVAAIVLLWRLARRWYTAPVALAAAAVLALWPAHVYYSGEFRYQTMAAVFALISFDAFLQRLEENRARKTYLLATIAGCYTHYIFIPLVLTQALVLFWQEHDARRRLKKDLLIVLLAFLPGLLTLALQLSMQNYWIKQFAGETAGQWFKLLGFWTIGGVPWCATTIFSVLDKMLEQSPTQFKLWFVILTLPVLILLIRGIVFSVRERVGRIVILWALMPTALLFLAGLFAPVFDVKVLVPTLPALALVLARGAAGNERNVIGWVLLAFFGVLAVAAIVQHKTDSRYFRDDWRGRVAMLQTDWQQNDVILNATFELRHYAVTPLAEARLYARPPKEVIQRGFVQTAEETALHLERELAPYRRIWFYCPPLRPPVVQDALAYLQENFYEITPEQYLPKPRFRLFTKRDRHAYAAHLAPQLTSRIDFTQGVFNEEQLRGIWLPTDRGWRWTTNSSSVWLKLDPQHNALRARIYVNMDLIPPSDAGEQGLVVDLQVEGYSITKQTITKTDQVVLSGALPTELNNLAAVETSIRTDRIIFQDTNDRLPREQARTVLVGEIELTAASLDDTDANGQPLPDNQ